MTWRPVGTHPDNPYKARFHYNVRTRLMRMAADLGWDEASYDLYSVPEESHRAGLIIFHHDQVYICVDQSTHWPRGWEIRMRPCKSRTDQDGGPDRFEPLELLDDPDALAKRVSQIAHLSQYL